MDLSTINTIAGLFSLGLTLLVSCIGGFYVIKSGVGKTTSDAQNSALAAMHSEMEILRSRIDDREKEIRRLERIIDTICMALKSRGITITVTGEMINIEVEDGKKITSVRIDETYKTS